MKKKPIRNISKQMFDIRPSDEFINLNVKKTRAFNQITSKQGGADNENTFRIFSKTIEDGLARSQPNRKIKKSFQDKRSLKIYQLGRFFDVEEVPVFHESQIHYKEFSFFDGAPPSEYEPTEKHEEGYNQQNRLISFDEMLLRKHISRIRIKRAALAFGVIAFTGTLLFSGLVFIQKGMELRNSILMGGNEAYANLLEGKDEILNRNFEKSEFEFAKARDNFAEISGKIGGMGNFVVEISRFFPFASKVSSGSYLAKAGQNISEAGILSGEIMKTLDAIKNPLDQDHPVSFLDIFKTTAGKLEKLLFQLEEADNNLSRVNMNDIPEDKRAQFLALKDNLPELRRLTSGFLDNSDIIIDVLGGNGQRKYLFLFQNNQEMRATGGFIGSYGILDISNGHIKNFFIDGIFNPDGQLREKVVPPGPIQKISAAWSLHDSNWFPDFPVSAEKAAWFYEKTGGPTVDGIITMTPTVMQKLLEITGPIEMPEYELEVNAENFIEKIQYEVEVDYDREENNPKQILADLAPRILDKVFNSNRISSVAQTLNVLVDSLNEKQILIYSKNYDMEQKLSRQGWTGEILDSNKDYLSVINSNINGFKTDGVVKEEISHSAEIQEDGSIIDTLVITRRHEGGDTGFEWWDKVNADYMRIYVPKGSELISVEGQTREFNSPPLDYSALNFKRDPQVQSQEDSMEVDSDSGTSIYEDAGKTVFANWVYVSPKETVIVKYKYLLPFKISMGSAAKPADTYSLLAQKQSGSLGSHFRSSVEYPKQYDLIWKYPDKEFSVGVNSVKFETDLKTDKFIGLAFTNQR